MGGGGYAKLGSFCGGLYYKDDCILGSTLGSPLGNYHIHTHTHVQVCLHMRTVVACLYVCIHIYIYLGSISRAYKDYWQTAVQRHQK